MFIGCCMMGLGNGSAIVFFPFVFFFFFFSLLRLLWEDEVILRRLILIYSLHAQEWPVGNSMAGKRRGEERRGVSFRC